MIVRPAVSGRRALMRVFLMDLGCTVPYYTGYLGRALREAKVDVTVGTVTYHLDPAHFARLGLRTDPGAFDVVGGLGIRRPWPRRALRTLELAANLVALAVRWALAPPDVVHVQYIPLAEKGLSFEAWFLRLVRRRGSKVVYTVHNVLPHDRGAQRAALYQRIYRIPDRLVCHTAAARDRLIREFSIDGARIEVIPHGPLFHDLAPSGAAPSLRQEGGGCTVLCQGFVKPYKGIEFLLEAWALLAARHPSARLIVAGTGDDAYLRAIARRVEELGVTESVRLDFRFTPADELASLHAAADVLVYPYREVTGSGALMTGLAHGKAMVATALPAFQEVLRDGVSGRLVAYGDSAGLAETLGHLIADPDERRRLGEAARRTMEAPAASWERIARQTRDCYQTLLTARP
jgi:glycosyltransferase involved in cell wall biosynthesis